ncbi:MAG: DUF5668 domain-containing protein [Petrimonas sp.]|nr:DUF5668 domain-containing protein [Petrimonas sp.]
MENYNQHSFYSAKSKSILFGVLLVLAGIVFLAYNFGWINPALKDIIFYWPMIFIVLSLFSLAKGQWGGFFIKFIVGAFFLAPRIAQVYPELLPDFPQNFVGNYWPFLLILLGIALIFKINFGRGERCCRRNKDATGNQNAEHLSGRIKKEVVFGGSENIFLDPVFYGGDIDAVFGGVILDLRKTTLPEGETYLNIDAVFGGVTLYIPDNWVVTVKFDTVFGGFTDKRILAQLPEDKTRKLILAGDLVFGGCEIK